MKKYFEMDQFYAAPKIEVTEIASEGVLCSSFSAPDWGEDDEMLN